MTATESLFTHWYFHLPNYALAVLMYTLIGRFFLMFVIPPESKNYIWRTFVRLTDPVLAVVGFLTPRATPFPIVLLFGIVWLFAVRVVLFAALAQAGLVPTVR